MWARWPGVLAVCAASLAVAGTLSAAAVGRAGTAVHGVVAARTASPPRTAAGGQIAAAGHTAAAGPFATLLFLQADYSAKCFAWGRRYVQTGTTVQSAGTTPPFWQHTEAVAGGACNVPTASCYGTPRGFRYSAPDEIIAHTRALQPGQWFTLEAFVLVTGTNPPYTTNRTR
jgi:hypothetical protein